MRKRWMMGAMACGLLLAGCASDNGLQGDSIGARRPECLVGGDPVATARDAGSSARDRDCGTDRSLRWSTEQNGKDSMKVDFGRKND